MLEWTKQKLEDLDIKQKKKNTHNMRQLSFQ